MIVCYQEGISVRHGWIKASHIPSLTMVMKIELFVQSQKVGETKAIYLNNKSLECQSDHLLGIPAILPKV